MSGTTDGVVIIQSGSMLDKSYLDPMLKLNRIDVMCLRRVYVRRKCQITKDKTVRYFGDSRCVFLVGGGRCNWQLSSGDRRLPRHRSALKCSA